MAVHLQREARAGLHLDALDLEFGALLEHRVRAPGAMHRAMQLVRLVALGLELRVDMLHVLRVALGCDEKRIGGVDDQQVLHADGADHPPFAADVAIRDLVQHGGPLEAVAVGVGLGEIADRAPRADVAPADVAGDHRDVAGLFHQRVVDRVVGRERERVGVELELSDAFPRRAARARDAFRDGGYDAGAMLAHLGQHRARGKAEHPRVPEEAPGIDVGARPFRGWLLDEAQDLVAVGLDVAVAGLGRCGTDAESDESALLREPRRLRDRRGECRLVEHEVIRGQHQHHRIVAVRPGRHQRRRGDRGRGAASERLEDIGCRQARGAKLAELVLGLEEELAVGDGEDLGRPRQQGAAQVRLLQKALPVGETDERLGMHLARNRPQARSRAAAKDGRDQPHRVTLSRMGMVSFGRRLTPIDGEIRRELEVPEGGLSR